MSESCTAVIVNNSGRSLDAIMLWHTPGEPGPADILPASAILFQQNVANGAQVSATAELSWGSPTDYWTCQILYEGDGQTYVMSGDTAAPYKEFEVSDGTTVIFTLAAYTSGTTDQSDGNITYSAGGGSSADTFRVLNPVTAMIWGGIWELSTHFLTESAVG